MTLALTWKVSSGSRSGLAHLHNGNAPKPICGYGVGPSALMAAPIGATYCARCQAARPVALADELEAVLRRATLAPLLERWDSAARAPYSVGARTIQQAYADCAAQLRAIMEEARV